MALSAFDDKSHAPEPAELKKVLGRSARLWDQLIAHVEARYPPVARLWNFSGAKYGWSLRLKQKDRVILYMTPQSGCFLAGLVLGERAVRAAKAAGLPEAIAKIIDSAPKYAEGTGVRIPVSTSAGATAVERLAECKMAG